MDTRQLIENIAAGQASANQAFLALTEGNSPSPSPGSPLQTSPAGSPASPPSPKEECGPGLTRREGEEPEDDDEDTMGEDLDALLSGEDESPATAQQKVMGEGRGSLRENLSPAPLSGGTRPLREAMEPPKITQIVNLLSLPPTGAQLSPGCPRECMPGLFEFGNGGVSYSVGSNGSISISFDAAKREVKVGGSIWSSGSTEEVKALAQALMGAADIGDKLLKLL